MKNENWILPYVRAALVNGTAMRQPGPLFIHGGVYVLGSGIADALQHPDRVQRGRVRLLCGTDRFVLDCETGASFPAARALAVTQMRLCSGAGFAEMQLARYSGSRRVPLQGKPWPKDLEFLVDNLIARLLCWRLAIPMPPWESMDHKLHALFLVLFPVCRAEFCCSPAELLFIQIFSSPLRHRLFRNDKTNQLSRQNIPLSSAANDADEDDLPF